MNYLEYVHKSETYILINVHPNEFGYDAIQTKYSLIFEAIPPERIFLVLNTQRKDDTFKVCKIPGVNIGDDLKNGIAKYIKENISNWKRKP